MPPDNLRPVNRQRAQSGRVSFTEPIAIRNGRDTYFEVLLQYIPRNNGPDELAPKFLYWKEMQGNFRVGFPAEFTLTQDEALRLKEVLERGLALAESDSDGSFLLLRLDGQETNLTNRNGAAVGRAVAGILNNSSVLSALASAPDGAEVLSGMQASVRLTELHVAIRELESKLDEEQVTDEQAYQKWCENHCWAFGHAYVMRDEVRNIALGDQVDLLMQSTANGLRDIFELKRPDMDVIKYDNTHKSWYWSSDTSKAIGQCHRYLDALHEAAARGLRDHPEIVAYHPKAVIIIGRSVGWSPDQLRALHGLNARLHSIQVMTFDQLLGQAKQLVATLQRD